MDSNSIALFIIEWWNELAACTTQIEAASRGERSTHNAQLWNSHSRVRSVNGMLLTYAIDPFYKGTDGHVYVLDMVSTVLFHLGSSTVFS